MTQYLVTTFKDSIGYVHPHVTAAKPNQTFTVVEAESKGEALEKVDKPKGLLSYVKRPGGTLEEQLRRIQDKALNDARKDSDL